MDIFYKCKVVESTLQILQSGFPLIFQVTDRHCVKSVRIRSFYGLYFPAFGLNMERYVKNKIRTRKTPNMDTFHAVRVYGEQ